MKDSSPIFIGVDGSGTRTVALVGHRAGPAVASDHDDGILGRGEAGPANPSEDGLTAAADRIQRAINAALANASLPALSELRLGQLILGIADATRAADLPRLATVVADRLLVPPERVRVVAGVRLILPAAGLATGVALEVESRSSAFGIAPDGRTVLVGGSSVQIGDDGSAFAVGREALRAVLRADGGLGPPTRLTGALAGELGVSEPRDLIRIVYQAQSARTTMATLAPLVLDTARVGDTTARAILTRTGRELGKLVRAAARRLDLGPESVVVAAGGMFRAGELILEPLRDELARAGLSDLRTLDGELALGALRLATGEPTPRPLSVVT